MGLGIAWAARGVVESTSQPDAIKLAACRFDNLRDY